MISVGILNAFPRCTSTATLGPPFYMSRIFKPVNPGRRDTWLGYRNTKAATRPDTEQSKYRRSEMGSRRDSKRGRTTQKLASQQRAASTLSTRRAGLRRASDLRHPKPQWNKRVVEGCRTLPSPWQCRHRHKRRDCGASLAMRETPRSEVCWPASHGSAFSCRPLTCSAAASFRHWRLESKILHKKYPHYPHYII